MSTKEGLGTIHQRTMFHWEHGTAPEMVDHVKSVVVGNNNIIQLYMDLGKIDEERLMEIKEDEELQDKYSKMMRKIGVGGKNSDESKEDILSLPVDEMCGFFEYYKETYEKSFDVEFISSEEKARCR